MEKILIPWKTVKGTCLSLTVYFLSDQMNSSDFFFWLYWCKPFAYDFTQLIA